LDMNNRMLTDGITEPRNKQQKEFGRPNWKNCSPTTAALHQSFLQTLEKSIKNFIADAQQFDDLIYLTFKAI
jgi:serine phosphatase RsbU (regulator of sigma subunit)